MFILYDPKEILQYLHLKLENVKKERYCMSQLDDYMANTNNRVCCIYGLRRTGKSILMLQQLEKQLSQNIPSIYVICNNGDDLTDLYAYLRQNPQIQNIFIDEITACDNFLSGANILSDIFVGMGKRVIITGTDSLGIALANDRGLYDRSFTIHTTYIPFKEYHDLLGKNIHEYLKYGGTLTDGSFNYNEVTEENYTNIAIIDNILRSVDQLADQRENGRLVQLYNDGTLKSVIEKALEINNRQFLLRTLNRKFKSHDWGSAKELLAKHALPIPQIDEEQLREELMSKLEIREQNNIQTSDIGLILSFLKKMDIIDEIGTEVIFTQPGLRFSQLEVLLQNLLNQMNNLSYIEKDAVQAIITHDILGRLFEDIVFYSIYKEFINDPNYVVCKYTNNLIGGEYDCVILNKEKREAFVLEIKYTTISNRQQIKNLDNTLDKGKQMTAAFEKEYGYRIIGSAVVYNGLPTEEKGIPYFYASKFLTQITETLTKEFKNIQQQKEDKTL